METNRIEYKSKLTDKLEREVVAFLNYHEGGNIYIGIDDKGNAVGVENIDSTQLRIVDRIISNILPSTLGLFDVVTENISGKDIINIIISSGTEKPYYLKTQGMSPNGCYIRVGSSVQQMTTAMIEETFSKRTRNTLGNIGSPRSELTFEQLKIYYEEKGLKLNEQFRTSLELLTKKGELNYIAYLLADENGTSIKVAKYAGMDKVDLVENEEYGYCCLIKAADRVLEKLNIENKTFAKITSTKREEKNLVNKVALREAVINAIVHNDYSREVPPVFEIFSDRIVITSYGGLVDGLSEEDFFKCCSMPRNRQLMRVFKDVGLVEQLGSGMSRILKYYDKSSFEILPNFIKLTFKFNVSDDTLNDTLNLNYTSILKCIVKDKNITINNISEITGVSKITVKRYLLKMQNEGRIKRVGSKKTGYWNVLDEKADIRITNHK